MKRPVSGGLHIYTSRRCFQEHPKIVVASISQEGTYVLERMQLLYVLKKQKGEEGLNWEEKTKLRSEKSIPVPLGLKRMDDTAASISNPARRPPKSPLGQAIAYLVGKA